MLAEIISFGGYAKDISTIIRERRKKPVRLKAQSDEKTVLVQIKTKQRDNIETIDEIDNTTGKKTGKKVDNPRYGKFYYESVHSFELEQTNAAEVKEAVLRGIAAAAKK